MFRTPVGGTEIRVVPWNEYGQTIGTRRYRQQVDRWIQAAWDRKIQKRIGGYRQQEQ